MQTVIIGGGIIGLLTARELVMAGHNVTVLDQGQIGAEASWAGGGILSPLYPWRYSEPVNQLAKWSQQHFAALAAQLIQEGGTDPQWTQSGLLVLDRNEQSEARQWAQSYGLPCELVDVQRLAELEPELAIPDKSALWFPTLAQVRNPRLVKSMVESCEKHGVQLRPQTQVTGITLRGQRATAVETSRGSVAADTIVVASGAWSARLLSGLGMQVPVRPVRGQMIMYHAAPGQIRHINLYEGHYVIPRQDGRVLVGSTLEEVEFDKSTTADAREILAGFAHALFPVFRDMPIEHHWAGLRPGSPDGIPYICAVPDIGGLYLNTGHYRNGVVLGYASARLLVDLILERQPILEPAPYRLAS
ncbi:MAG: glycine oxidase ThiO [Gammaproteobacteria bacterium]|nr:glycine oxidase ThiO [Gammaproteobacteria bacterium]